MNNSTLFEKKSFEKNIIIIFYLLLVVVVVVVATKLLISLQQVKYLFKSSLFTLLQTISSVNTKRTCRLISIVNNDV